MKFSIHINHNPEATGYEPRWTWEVKDEKGRSIDHGHTNAEGRGVWAFDKQIVGTCDFIAPSTRSGLRAKLIRTRYDSWVSSYRWHDFDAADTI